MLDNQRADLRIVWAIAAKDIVDAIKNKTTLSIMLGVGLMMLSGMAMPLLLGMRDTPIAAIYDPNKSTLIRGLAARSEFRLILVDSLPELESTVSGSSELILGIVIPESFQADLVQPQDDGSGGTVEMEGYVVHWADPGEAARRAAFFEAELGKASWQTVHINVSERRIYPSPDLDGQPFLTTINAVILMIAIGMILAPYLLIEEKETHTFDALLVSPARLSQVMTGKALAGGFYCLCAAVVILAFNARWIVHWELAILALFLGAAFAVGVGLLLGALYDTPATVGLWAGALLMIMIVPMLLARLASMPPIVRAVLPWVPSVAMSKLVGFSMAGAVPAGPAWTNVGILAAEALIVYAILVWRVRRSDR